MDIKYIGKNIAKLRVARELTQGELGAKIGLTPSAISNIENATSYPSINTVILFANYFGVTVDYLLTDEASKELDELYFKSKLLTIENFLKTGKEYKCSYEMGGKKYLFEEEQNEITYRVIEVNE
ncbi:MAG: helix-turn-helix transcriptional regulator [Lachnospira sp.]|nr:helix-turn-helix transcriptional regulator [Lachnospiraceae bacterium]MEE0217754.1 helix-turn-helix transcriptional regulator [Lachnospira sp.]